MTGRPGRAVRIAALVAALATTMALVNTAGAVQPPPGAGKPVAGTGIGTAAALANPKCAHDDAVRYGVYGRLPSTVVGNGPVCVTPWKDGADNGGATSPGVTKDRILVYAVIPNDQQLSMVGGATPMKRADNSKGTYQDAIHDYLLAAMKFYETYGRDIEMRYYVSTGQDEAAQRADAVEIKAAKPFAVMDLAPTALDVFDTEMANAKIVVFGFSTTTQKALAQAPYRWGQSDTQAAATNSTEVIGKQLVGKKAQFGGDDVKTKARKFGAVYIQDIIDLDQMKANFKKYGGTIASDASYTANGSTIGDATSAQEQAPVIVTRLKQAGVTTVILFTDVAMTKSLMDNATKQEWFPEWFFTGTVFQDLALLAHVPDRPVLAHVRHLERIPVGVSGSVAGGGQRRCEGTPRLVLGCRRGHHGQLAAATDRLAPRRDPCRRTEAHAQDVPARALLRSRVRWRRTGVPDGNHDRVRQERRPALRRVHAGRYRLRGHLVGSRDQRSVAGHRDRRQGRGLVRQRRQAIQERHGHEEAVRLVRQGHVRVQVRHPPHAHAGLCGRLRGLPQPGRRRAGGHPEHRRIRREVKRKGRNAVVVA